MPSVTTGDNAVHSSSPDLASAPCEALKQVLGVIDKKVRNMEKKKSKLDDYQTRKNKGERLNQDQLEALSKAPEVAHNLDFARELQKSFLALNMEIQKSVKKATRREQLKREEVERKRLKAVLEVQYLLEQLGEESVRQDLTQSSGDAPVLTESELTGLDEFYKLIGPERDSSVRLAEQFEEASLHLWELLEGRDKAVAGTTYKALKESLDKMLLSGHFDRAQTHQNGVCEEETGAAAAAESSESEERPAEPEGATEEYTETIEVEETEFVNRQLIPEATYSSSDKEQGAEWNTSSQAVSALQQPQQPPAAMSPALVSSEAHTLNAVLPPPAADPVVRSQAVQDLMAQMQGTFNFMQDSMLEFEGPPLDPAIVLAQPMKPAQMVCQPESRLPQHNALSVQPEPVPMVSAPKETYSSTPPLYQPPHNSEPRPQSDTIEPLQVFNMNAPVPPTGEMDSQKISSQYQSSYGQGFSTQATLPAEQQELPQETLQSVGPFHSQDQGIPSAGGHQSPSQQPSGQSTGFGRPGQSFYNNRAMPRAGPRNPRGALNGFRGPSNGFRGGYDGYRAPFPNTPNTGYGQTQFSTPRDYSNNTYQRDGYQQSFKRGATQGPRGCSRGRGGSFRSSRGMGPMAAQQTS
ncbi:caprin-1-like isoform X6 [Carassius carassius]|uniref:caprin-1-like isoform X6 n=1 Tax=Carassius carassius TaxID=217509 RepID=UPI002868B6B7|nr:caprin-1-like isoform X6 [Carassius carassius]